MKKIFMFLLLSLSLFIFAINCDETDNESPASINTTTTLETTTIITTTTTTTDGPYIPQNQDLKLLSSWMTGSFDNYTQYQSNPSFYVIELRMKRVWDKWDNEDAVWMYVEQAYSDKDPAFTTDQVYRQRVYKLYPASTSDVFVSAVYKFTNSAVEDVVEGAWQEDEPLSNYSESDITLMNGCEVYLTKTVSGTSITFEGGTVGTGCLTSYPGAEYATSVVTITENSMDTLDRMFNSSGTQVGGSTIGPYQFDKLSNYDTELD